MKTAELTELTTEVRKELERRGYSPKYIENAMSFWERLSNWCKTERIEHFSEEVANRYLDETLGFHIIPSSEFTINERNNLRAIRLLVTYMKDGDFEFRTPRTEKVFCKELAPWVDKFLLHRKECNGISDSTANYYRHILFQFSLFLEARSFSLYEMDVHKLEDFFCTCKSSNKSTRDFCRTIMRSFFDFLYSQNATQTNFKGYVLKASRAPTQKEVIDTYSEEEIKKVLSNMERGSAIGKRNYLVALLASTYGLRSGDITRLRLDQIDWYNNQIKIIQDKTKTPLSLPLLASVGNAIIDYWKHGRPKEAKDETIVVSHMQSTIGTRLTSPTIHSIVSKAFSEAEIPGWKEKKHGAHSLRHSLATNLLKRNVSMPIISTVLGHRSTETTKVYIGVDIVHLKACTLPMPPLHSRFYTNGKEDVR